MTRKKAINQQKLFRIEKYFQETVKLTTLRGAFTTSAIAPSGNSGRYSAGDWTTSFTEELLCTNFFADEEHCTTSFTDVEVGSALFLPAETITKTSKMANKNMKNGKQKHEKWQTKT